MKIINFDPKVFLSVSDVSDGNMKNPKLADWTDDEINQNRKLFLEKSYISPQDTAWVVVDYSRNTFSKYFYINSSGRFKATNPKSTIPTSDGLATMSDNLGIFLPLADCIGAVMYDTNKKLLMVTHAGRHNLEENGLAEAVKFMKKYGAKPKSIKVWLSPSAGVKNYPLYKFDNKSLEQVAREQLVSVGVNDISSAGIDTTIDKNYYSHSQGDLDKRFAILAYIK